MSKIEIDEFTLSAEIEKAAQNFATGFIKAVKGTLECGVTSCPPRVTVNAKTMTTSIASPVTKAVTRKGFEPINKAELASINSLVGWVAVNHNVKTETVVEIIKDEFSVDHIAEIHRHDFQRTMGYLINLQTDLNTISKRTLN